MHSNSHPLDLPSVQWFPGHMHKAKLALQGMLRAGEIDAVIMLLDARLPGSSINPMIEHMTNSLPRLLLLNKYDLADERISQVWLSYFHTLPHTQAIPWSNASGDVAQIRWRLLSACRKLAPQRTSYEKPLRIFICGIPNVGKSSLINQLMQRKLAKTGNEPGITKTERRIVLSDDVVLIDSPGLLWPKIHIPEVGVRLAVSGAIGRNAIDEIAIAYVLLEDLQTRYPDVLKHRYQIDDLNTQLPIEELYRLVALRCSALRKGGKIDEQKTAERILEDFRSGAMGKVSLEQPEEYLSWQERERSQNQTTQVL